MDMDFHLDGDVSIKGTSSIDNLSKSFEKAVGSSKNLEKGVMDLELALKTLSPNGALSVKELNKALQVLDKSLDSIGAKLDNVFKNRSFTAGNTRALSPSEVESRIKSYRNEQLGLRLLGAFDKVPAVASFRKQNFITGQSKSYDLAFEQKKAFLDRREQALQKEFESKMNSYRNEQLGLRMMGAFNNLPAVSGTRAVGEVMKSFQSRFAEEFERQSRLQATVNGNLPSQTVSPSALIIMGQEKANYQKTFLGAYLKAEKEQSVLDNAITAAKKEEAEAAKRSAETAKKTAGLTADQAEKYKQQQNRTDAYNKRTDAESAKFDKYIADKEKGRQFKLDHPEFFLSGGYLRDPRYQFGKAFEGIGAKASTFGVGSDKLEGRAIGGVISAIGTLMKSPVAGCAAALMGVANGILEVSKAATQAYAEIESIRTQLGVVFSSQARADSMFGELAQYATKSPFGVQQASELAILLKQSGVYASDLMDTLKMIGDTAGGNMEKMKRIANNYAQIVSIGKASMLDMRQFAYAGIPIFEAVSKELGVSQQELRKLISDGKVTSDIIEKVFKDLTGINGIFENATEKGARTLKARLQNLADAKQLAMAEVGESFFNIGENTGDDSLINRLVTTAENIYQWLHDWRAVENIEHSVKVIENRDVRIDTLQKSIDYLESKKTRTKEENETLKGLKDLLSSVLGKRDIDKERSVYKTGFDYKTSDWQEYLKAQGGFKRDDLSIDYMEKTLFRSNDSELIVAELNEKLRAVSYAIGKIYNETAQAVGANGSTSNSASQVRLNAALQENADYQALLTREKEYSQALEMFKKSRTYSSEQLQAKKESNVIDAQSLASDTYEKTAKESDSLYNKLQKLGEIYKNSAEVKAKTEQEEIESLKKAQEELKKLKPYLDDKGILDFLKIPLDEFSEWIDKKVFTVERNLTVVEGKSVQQMKDDRPILERQVFKVLGDVEDKLGSLGFMNAREKIDERFGEAFVKKSNVDFYKAMAAAIDDTTKEIAGMQESGSLDEKTANSMIKNLISATLKLSTDISGLLANPEELQKGSSNINIPLYKRILAEYTGLTTNGMKNTQSTLENYRDDMAIRNRTASVLSATLKSMGAETAMGLVRTEGQSKVLPYAPGSTYQVSWKETEKALKEFTMNLSASAEVISAYREGLEAELDTYNKLIVAGYTQGESQDLKDQKTISGKQFEKIIARGDQLVNAFGDKLITKEGLEVEFKNGKFFDKNGTEVEVKELIMTETLYNFILKELPRIREDIRQSRVVELNNSQLAIMLKNTEGTMLSNGLLASRGVNNATAYMLNNSEYTKQLFDTNLMTLKNTAKYKDSFQGMSNSDILIAANNGNLEALALIDEVYKHMEEGAEALINSNTFKKLEDQTRILNRDNAVNARLQRLNGINSWDINEDNRLTPEEYGGKRGVRNFLLKSIGAGRDYDIEDLYVKAALMAPSAGKETNFAGFTKFQVDTNKQIYDEAYEKAGGDKNPAEARLAAEQAVLETLKEEEKYFVQQADFAEELKTSMIDMAESLSKATADFAKGTFLAPFEYLGESLVDSDMAAKDLKANMRQLSSELLKNVGSAMANAGFQIAASAAMEHNWSGVAAGLALAAAGGFASGLGGAFGKQEEDKDDSDDKLQKLNKLKEDLSDLLKQAREDAIYYENTLRHKNALSTNSSLGKVTKVNDAIITPSGDVVTTHPDDYLIATKTPQTLIGGGAPTINFSVIDKSTGIKVTQQKSVYNRDSNSIDFTAVIESKVKEIIATSAGDEAFMARQARMNGVNYVA